MSQFKFDFDAIKGKTYEDGFVALFQQLEDHYNTHVNVKPAFVFGADPASPGGDFGAMTVMQGDTVVAQHITPPKSMDLIPVESGYEIKEGKDLGLKAGAILTGVRSDTNVEIFDFLKNYQPGDQIVEGDSGKYDLGRS